MTAQGGYHSAKAMMDAIAEILQALNNLAMAATVDHNVMEQLNGVVSQLTESNKQLM